MLCCCFSFACFSEELKIFSILELFKGQFSASKAKKLVTYLDFPEARLQEFKKIHIGNAHIMLMKVLIHWLDSDEE